MMNHSEFNPEEVPEAVKEMWKECMKKTDISPLVWTLAHSNPQNTDIRATYKQAQSTTIDESKIANALSLAEAITISFREDSLLIFTLAFATKTAPDSTQSSVQALSQNLGLFCIALQENEMLKTVASLESVSKKIEFIGKFMKKIEDVRNRKK